MAEGDRINGHVTVVTESRNLKTKPFISRDDHIATGKAWKEWLEGIEREFRYFNITDSMNKKDAMIIFGGRDLARIEKSLPNPTDPGLNEYDRLRKKLNDHNTPKRNKHYARYQFLNMRTTAFETTASYTARLREKANECDFEETLEDRILEHIIQTIDNRTLIQKCINKGWNLNQFVLEASQMEDISFQVRDMKPAYRDKSVAKINCHNSYHYGRQQLRERSRIEQKSKLQERDRCKSHPCDYCGHTGFHSRRRLSGLRKTR